MALIHAAAFPHDAWDAATLAGFLTQPGVFGLIDSRGGFVLARLAADEAEILTIAVLPEARRQGVGGTLLQALLDEAARRGARAMFLEVSTANLAAGRLYERNGFVQVGLRARYYDDGYDARVMRRDLR